MRHNAEQIPFQGQFVDNSKAVCAAPFQFNRAFILIRCSVCKCHTNRCFRRCRHNAMRKPRQIGCQNRLCFGQKMLLVCSIGKRKAILRRKGYGFLLRPLQKDAHPFQNRRGTNHRRADFPVLFKKFTAIRAANQIGKIRLCDFFSCRIINPCRFCPRQLAPLRQIQRFSIHALHGAASDRFHCRHLCDLTVFQFYIINPLIKRLSIGKHRRPLPRFQRKHTFFLPAIDIFYHRRSSFYRQQRKYFPILFQKGDAACGIGR